MNFNFLMHMSLVPLETKIINIGKLKIGNKSRTMTSVCALPLIGAIVCKFKHFARHGMAFDW